MDTSAFSTAVGGILLGAQVARILMIEPDREVERGPEREPAA